MKLVFVEFTWQVKEIINSKNIYKKDIVVSLDPESSYNLKVNKVNYLESYQICKHKELWSKYAELTNRTIRITKILGEVLWKVDERYKNLDWNLFDDYHYQLKISFDQLFYYSELIANLIEKFNPSEIIVADTKQIMIDNNFKINSKTSVIKYLLEKFKNNLQDIKVSFVSPTENQGFLFLSGNNFKKFTFFLKKKIVNFYNKLNFLFNFYTSKPKYLSIACGEVLKYKKLYPKESNLFLSYHHENFNKKKFAKDTAFVNKFINCLKNETDFYSLIRHKNISFELIFHQILLKLVNQLDFAFDEYKNAKKIVKKIKPECVIFQSMAPFYTSMIPFRKSCFDFNIPFVTWSHGGYGLTYSISGYDVTDFRFCKNHIVYGNHVKDLVQEENCVLKKLNFDKDHKFFPVGSPKMDYENKRKKIKKIINTNHKRTVLFLMVNVIIRNRFYFGRNREKFETANWEFHYDIVSLLKKYQNKYNIIFKDYPNGYKNLWKKVLVDINANKILYISNEHKVNDLLRISDLNIIPWISTTFFEALYFDADIFVCEEDLFEKTLKNGLKDEIFYFKNERNFLLSVEKYLETGNFYTRTKKNSKNYFMNLDGLNKRDNLLNNSLSKLALPSF